jgi:hypothetical protein
LLTDALEKYCNITLALAKSSNPLVSLREFSLESTDGRKLKCVVVWKIKYSQKAPVLSFLSDVKVRYVTTVGWCGGREADFGKVIFFGKAIMTDNYPDLIRFGARDIYLDEWRGQQPEFAFPFVRPEQNIAILTSLRNMLQGTEFAINQFHGSKENM